MNALGTTAGTRGPSSCSVLLPKPTGTQGFGPFLAIGDHKFELSSKAGRDFDTIPLYVKSD